MMVNISFLMMEGIYFSYVKSVALSEEYDLKKS